MSEAQQFKEIVFPHKIAVRRTTIHETVQDELEDLFQNPLEQRVLGTVLERRLPYLEQNLENALMLKSDWYEPVLGVKGCKEIFSIHGIKQKELNNLRILYCIKDHHVYLLYAFCEKKKANYHRYAKTAKERMKVLNE